MNYWAKKFDLCSVCFRRAIFIFLSNIGSNLITERYLELWQKHGKTRDQMSLHDFDSVINKGAFNEKGIIYFIRRFLPEKISKFLNFSLDEGGFHMSDLIDHNLIDHYVPFLPLERIHVEQCIKAELDNHNYRHDDSIIELVLEILII